MSSRALLERDKRRAWLGASSLLLLLVSRAGFAAVITVNGSCTLADAILAANTDAPVGGCVAGSGADTIVLTGSVGLTAANNVLNGPNGLPTITSEIVVEANGFLIQREDSAAPFRVFHVSPSGSLTLENATVSGGRSPAGAGIFNAEGTVSLVNSTVTGNAAADAYGFYGYYPYFGSYGGGIYNRLGTLTLTNSAVSGNASTEDQPYGSGTGGGITNSGVLSLSNSTVSANAASGPYSASGGGIFNFRGGTATITNSTVSYNSSLSFADPYGPVSSYDEIAYGGGIANYGSLTVDNSALYNNLAEGPGRAYGGGVFAYDGEAHVTNSTLSGNRALSFSIAGGGGIWNLRLLDLVSTTVSGNSTESSPYGYALAGNLSNQGSAGYGTNTLLANGSPSNCDRALDDRGGNLADDDSCGVPGTLTGLDPALSDNGGPTKTHALLAGSPAIDLAGTCSEAEDQRGAGRVGPCDSGAFEYIGCSPLVLDTRVITTSEAWETCHTAVLGPLLDVEGAGHLSMTAGAQVILENTTSFTSLTVVLDPSFQVTSPQSLELQGRGPGLR